MTRRAAQVRGSNEHGRPGSAHHGVDHTAEQLVGVLECAPCLLDVHDPGPAGDALRLQEASDLLGQVLRVDLGWGRQLLLGDVESRAEQQSLGSGTGDDGMVSQPQRLPVTGEDPVLGLKRGTRRDGALELADGALTIVRVDERGP